MRTLFLSTLLILMSAIVQAQNSDLKGAAIFANRQMWVDEGEIKSSKTEQCFTFSFRDKILCHNILDAGTMSEAQFYSLNDAQFNNRGDVNYILVKATSGLSGNTFTYEIKYDKDGNLITLTLTQPDGISKTTYTGNIVKAKSYKQ